MELEYRDLYIEMISKEVAQHTIFTGTVYAVVFSSAVSIILAIILKPPTIVLVAYTILIGFTPLLLLSIAYSKRNSKRFAERASEFVDLVTKLHERHKFEKIELLESPPPPLIAIIKHDDKFVSILFYSKTLIYLNLLEPVNVKETEGYMPVYLVKKKEWLSTRKIESRKASTYKAEAAISVPLKDQIIEGTFYITEVLLVNPTIENASKTLETILKPKDNT